MIDRYYPPTVAEDYLVDDNRPDCPRCTAKGEIAVMHKENYDDPDEPWHCCSCWYESYTPDLDGPADWAPEDDPKEAR